MFLNRAFRQLTYEKKRRIALIFFSVFVGLVILDVGCIYFNLPFFESSPFVEVLVEGVILLIGCVGFLLLWHGTNRDEKNQVTHIAEIMALKDQVEHWRKKSSLFSVEFTKIVETHFDIWGLSASEKEVGLYLLKGLSFEQIAELRNLSEKTIRNQASSIYGKSGLSGKHELAAFFLEEIL